MELAVYIAADCYWAFLGLSELIDRDCPMPHLPQAGHWIPLVALLSPAICVNSGLF